MIDELKDVFELAINCTSFVNELLKIKNTKNKLQQNSSGNYSQLASSGDSSQLASSGNYSQLASSGYSSQLASSGNYSQLASSGDSSKLASSGDSSEIDSTGENSVIASIGFRDIVKAKKGSWVTLAEYKKDENNNWIVDFVKTEQVDGEIIKENTYYTLYNHQFVEVQIIAEVKTIILQRKKNVIKGLFLTNLQPCYVVEKDGVYAHGATLKDAKESLIYKITDRDKSDYEDYTLDTEVTHEEAIKMYRVITGACEAGTRNFVENVLIKKKKKKKYTVKEIIKLTEGQYGNETLKEFMENK